MVATAAPALVAACACVAAGACVAARRAAAACVHWALRGLHTLHLRGLSGSAGLLLHLYPFTGSPNAVAVAAACTAATAAPPVLQRLGGDGRPHAWNTCGSMPPHEETGARNALADADATTRTTVWSQP